MSSKFRVQSSRLSRSVKASQACHRLSATLAGALGSEQFQVAPIGSFLISNYQERDCVEHQSQRCGWSEDRHSRGPEQIRTPPAHPVSSITSKIMIEIRSHLINTRGGAWEENQKMQSKNQWVKDTEQPIFGPATLLFVGHRALRLCFLLAPCGTAQTSGRALCAHL